MPGFGIETARGLLEKLEQDTADFHNSNNLSERHALNAVWTAYHMHEWVWGDLLKSNFPIQQALGLFKSGTRPDRDDFRDYLVRTFPAFEDARDLADATKHFDRKKDRSGTEFNSDFNSDFLHLWIERKSGVVQRAEDFLEEHLKFWRGFLDRHWP